MPYVINQEIVTTPLWDVDGAHGLSFAIFGGYIEEKAVTSKGKLSLQKGS